MNNERYYLLTGAAGFLGSNICAQLLAEGKKVRALVLPNDKSVKFIPKEVEVVIGDLCDEASLEPFFTVPGGCTSVIIHCASMVTVDPVAVYKSVEESVVGAYKAVEKGAVDAYRKVEDAMVDKLFRKEGETIAQAKDRLNKK